jgi:hypothetical protein
VAPTKLAVTLAILVCALAVVSRSAGAGGEISDEECLPISVWTTSGTFTYTVRVETGNVHCRLARAVLRDAALWPPDEAAAAADWSCSVGGGSRAWAVSCVRGPAIVRAYGPARERDPWVIAAARLRVPVLAPSSTFGLALGGVRRLRCGNQHKFLKARYARSDGATLTIAEGESYACGNLGVAPVLTSWEVHGHPARLLEWCTPTGCARLSEDYALEWRERGIEVVLVTHKVRQRELLGIARSMTLVPV